MYETHFGISGLPFQLSPDPAFYFDSQGHHQALEALRRGMAESKGLVAVTGEVGAGKTTLVRTVLGEKSEDRLIEAQICSTQLDADELLRAIVLAFGIAADDLSQEQLRPALDAFLEQARRSGRQAVLVIDEAQNLQRSAFELLVALGQDGLRICLVGQPELRQMLDGGELVHVRRHVEVSCHLGPLRLEEVARYVEHRLKKVGWQGQPSFEAGAFDTIFRATGGIPRRINTLCNRLLMSRFLASENVIDAEVVARTARDLQAELGGDVTDLALPASASRRSATSAAPASVMGPPATVPPRPRAPAGRPILCVVDGQGDHVKAAALLRAAREHDRCPPLVLVRVSNNDALMQNLALFDGPEVLHSLVSLEVDAADAGQRFDDTMLRFAAAVAPLDPLAVVVMGGDGAAACSLVARRQGWPVARLGAGQRACAASTSGEVADMLSDRLADRLYAWDEAAFAALVREGLPADRVVQVGNLVLDCLQAALRLSIGTAGGGMPIDAPHEYLVDRHGYALAALSHPANIDDRASLSDLVLTLRGVSRDLPVIWPVHPRVEQRLDVFRLKGLLAGERVASLPFKSHAEFVALLNNATCVLTDAWDVQSEASALGIPWLALGAAGARRLVDASRSRETARSTPAQVTRAVWECIFNGGARGAVPDRRDGKCAARLVDDLVAWLGRTAGRAADHSKALEVPA